MFSKFGIPQQRSSTPLSRESSSNQELERWLREDVLGLDQEPDAPASVPTAPSTEEKPGAVPHRDAA